MTAKLVINGAGGRMGKRILAIAAQNENLQIIGAVDAAGLPDMGKDAGVLAGIGEIGVELSSEFPADTDVMIDLKQQLTEI